MRISDWSSDVCSSDLILFDGAAMTWADPGGWVLSSLSQKIDLAGGNTYFPASSTPPTAGKVGDFWFDTSAGVLKRWDGTAWIGDEIGRESGRERVCQYV